MTASTHDLAGAHRPDSFLRPSQDVFGFRVRVDADTDRALADELELRARLLRETPEIPEPERQPYARAADLVASYTARDDWSQGRVARRIWKTDESVLHAIFVLFGTKTGTGCPCYSPDCEARRQRLAQAGR